MRMILWTRLYIYIIIINIWIVLSNINISVNNGYINCIIQRIFDQTILKIKTNKKLLNQSFHRETSNINGMSNGESNFYHDPIKCSITICCVNDDSYINNIIIMRILHNKKMTIV